MRVDPTTAFSMLKEANPIPDPEAYRRQREEFGVGPTARVETDGRSHVPPVTGRRRLRPALVILSTAVMVMSSLIVVDRLDPEPLTGPARRPPFDQAIDALGAKMIAVNEGDTETLVRLFAPGASVDEYGTTALWDAETATAEVEFRAGVGVEYVLDECWNEGERGICRLTYSDALLERAGIPRHAEEWAATLDAQGRIKTLRQRTIDSPELAQARAWFVDFNEWLCRHHPEDAATSIWDVRTRRAVDQGDCGPMAVWRWRTDRGADAGAVLRLHELYLADTRP